MIVGVLVAALFTGAANAESYECKVKIRGIDYGWISRALVINIPYRLNETSVENTLIKATGPTTVPADLSMYSKQRVTVSWELKGVLGPHGKNLGIIRYRATVLKPSNRISVTALDPGGLHSIGPTMAQGRETASATGKCVYHK